MPRLGVIDLRGEDLDPSALRGRLPRAGDGPGEARDTAREVLDDVAARGDEAVRERTRRYDGVDLAGLEVPDEVRREALAQLDDGLRDALEQAAAQVRAFHERARPDDWEAGDDGARMGQWHRAVRRVGCYVPGGKAPLVSTVVMTVVPAQVAGVGEIVVTSPPTGPGGNPDPTVLAATELLGVDRVLRVGGAQAVAALAYGTATVPACDKVVGPGNVFVTAAKQLLAADGACGIDLPAGPTEIAIVADDTADPGILAADLVAQAEHDELAACLLITPEEGLVGPVEEALEREIGATRHRERIGAALDGQGAVALVDDLDAAVAVAEAYAAEHLEVQTREPQAVAERIRWAGTTFVGADSPVSLGDYAAGPNHTLPTGGVARFTGGLTTASFLVPVNWVRYDREALAGLADSVRRLAAAEDLPAHARAVDARLEGRSP